MHTDGSTKGFVSDKVNVLDGEKSDDKLKDLLAFDGADIVDGTSGLFVAIRYQIEPGMG